MFALRRLRICFSGRPIATISVVCLLAASVAPYAKTLDNYFVADDVRLVEPKSLGELLPYFYSPWGHGNAYRPLIRVSFAWDYWWWQENPVGYHLTNIALHALDVLLLYYLLTLLIGRRLPAFVGALLFAIHPVHHENVTWISGRTHLLGAFFYLLAAIAYLRYLRHPSSSPPVGGVTMPSSSSPLTGERIEVRGSFPGREFHYLSALGAFLLGLMSYEAVLSLPLFLAALVVFEASGERAKYLKERLRPLVPFILLPGGYLVFRHLFIMNPFQYLPNEPIQSYAVLFTNLLGLNRSLWAGNSYLYPAVFLIGAVLLWKKYRLVVFSLAWIAIGYLPFLFVNGFTERFAYLSSAGAMMLVGLCLTSTRNSQLATRNNPASLWAAFPNPPRWLVRTTGIGMIALGLFLAKDYLEVLKHKNTDWKVAGEIARSIPAAVKALHPDFPEGAHLVFYNVPKNHGYAWVYGVYMGLVLQKHYPQRKISVYAEEYPKPSSRHKAVVPEKELNMPIYLFEYREGTIKELQEIPEEYLK